MVLMRPERCALYLPLPQTACGLLQHQGIAIQTSARTLRKQRVAIIPLTGGRAVPADNLLRDMNLAGLRILRLDTDGHAGLCCNRVVRTDNHKQQYDQNHRNSHIAPRKRIATPSHAGIQNRTSRGLRFACPDVPTAGHSQPSAIDHGLGSAYEVGLSKKPVTIGIV